MLRREREEGLGYGSCVETGECTVPCYVVWRVRELEYYWRSCSFFRIRSRSDASLIRSRGVSNSVPSGIPIHLGQARLPPRDRRPPCAETRVLRARGRAGGGGSLPPSVTITINGGVGLSRSLSSAKRRSCVSSAKAQACSVNQTVYR